MDHQCPHMQGCRFTRGAETCPEDATLFPSGALESTTVLWLSSSVTTAPLRVLLLEATRLRRNVGCMGNSGGLVALCNS